jgi:hypothetical protein
VTIIVEGQVEGDLENQLELKARSRWRFFCRLLKGRCCSLLPRELPVLKAVLSLFVLLRSPGLSILVMNNLVAVTMAHEHRGVSVRICSSHRQREAWLVAEHDFEWDGRKPRQTSISA